MPYTHQIYLSDGTILSQEQYDELYKKGELVLGDGRVLKADDKLRRGYLRAQELKESLAEIYSAGAN